MQVQGGAPLRIAEIEAAVRAAGYQTQSRDFSALVRQSLCGLPELERVGYGLYRLKAKPGV